MEVRVTSRQQWLLSWFSKDYTNLPSTQWTEGIHNRGTDATDWKVWVIRELRDSQGSVQGDRKGLEVWGPDAENGKWGPATLGTFCLPAKESDLCPGKDAAPLMSWNTGVTGSDPTRSGRTTHCCCDHLENWEKGVLSGGRGEASTFLLSVWWLVNNQAGSKHRRAFYSIFSESCLQWIKLMCSKFPH